MAKKVTYTEPASFFNADMKKATRDWEKAQKAKSQQVKGAANGKRTK